VTEHTANCQLQGMGKGGTLPLVPVEPQLPGCELGAQYPAVLLIHAQRSRFVGLSCPFRGSVSHCPESYLACSNSMFSCLSVMAEC
jgi:hypothetical protein